MKTKEKQKKIENLYSEIQRKVDTDTMSLINEMIDLELELESLSNK